jgi:hypothetical protein
MKKSILIALLLSILMSCEKEKNFNMCQVQVFSFYDASGNDLFDSNIDGHIDTAAFSSYNLSGKKINIGYWKYEGIYQFAIGVDAVDFTTILHFGDLTKDTLFAEYREKGNSLFIHKLYYNGKLVKTNDHSSQCGNGDVVDIVVKPDL